MKLKDSATVVWKVNSQPISINLLKDGAMDILRSLANMKIISFNEPKPNAETLAAFEETEEMIKTGNFGKGYKNAKSMIDDILDEE